MSFQNRAILFGFLLLNEESYERLKGFFRFRSVELDAGFELRLIDVATPEVSRELYELARSKGDAEASQVFVDAGSPDRLTVMDKLAALLAVSPDERPCIVFVESGELVTIARFKIEPQWYASSEARSTFGGVLLEWIANPELDRAKLSEGLESELGKIRFRLAEVFHTEPQS